MKHAIVLTVALLLAGCTNQLLRDDYAGQTAIVKDSYANYHEGGIFKSEQVELFAMVEADGKYIDNGLDSTSVATNGYRLRLKMVERRVPIKPMKVKLAALVFYPQGLFSGNTQGFLFGKKNETRKTVSFTPLAGEIYVVRGKLSDAGSDVWIETQGGRRITQ